MNEIVEGINHYPKKKYISKLCSRYTKLSYNENILLSTIWRYKGTIGSGCF